MHSHFNDLNLERTLREASQPLIKPFADALSNSKYLADRVQEGQPRYTAYYSLDDRCDRVVGIAVTYEKKGSRVVPSVRIYYDAILSFIRKEVDQNFVAKVKELTKGGEVNVNHEDSDGGPADDDTVLNVTYGSISPRAHRKLADMAKSIGEIDSEVAKYLAKNPISDESRETVRMIDQINRLAPWCSFD